ncbi:hypothetical protein [Actinophytocola sp.]|uniref:hypothetical protein n=1 Tax=Actinophytocola sp. TaxID=1872138 RepID=UPI002ED38228
MTWSVVWSAVIPTTMLHLGAFALVLAVALVFLDVPGKFPWDRIAAVLAVIGGFGVGGAAAGWLGGVLASASGTVISWGAALLLSAVGVAVVGALGFALGLWVYSRVKNKGIGAKSKFKALLIVFVLGMVGTVFAALPGAYGVADRVVDALGSGLIARIVA